MLVRIDIAENGVKVTPGNPSLNAYVCGTAILTDVSFEKEAVHGEVFETVESVRPLKMKKGWGRAIQTDTGFIDKRTQKELKTAKAAYVYEGNIFYKN